MTCFSNNLSAIVATGKPSGRGPFLPDPANANESEFGFTGEPKPCRDSWSHRLRVQCNVPGKLRILKW
ncbi:MAG: hypothetical protein ACP5MD_17370, partial [Verrucomicrobiia bacterium]